jgi:hypothetical protein
MERRRPILTHKHACLLLLLTATPCTSLSTPCPPKKPPTLGHIQGLPRCGFTAFIRRQPLHHLLDHGPFRPYCFSISSIYLATTLNISAQSNSFESLVSIPVRLRFLYRS